MKQLLFDQKQGKAKVRVENADDLWYLSQIVEAGDVVTGKTYRKVKMGGEGEKVKVDKKPVTLSLAVEKVDFSPEQLRIHGTVTEPKEDIPKGSHHALTVDEGYIITIQKEWLSYQKEKLKEAQEQARNILVVVLDREEARFAITKKSGIEVLTVLKGDVQKKDDRATTKGSFKKEIIDVIEQYVPRYKTDHIILASPAFWKDEVMKEWKNDVIKKKVVLAQCHSTEENAIKEVLKRPEVQTVLHQERVAQEGTFVDELLAEIKKSGKAAYGFTDVQQATQEGATETLLVTDSLIQERRKNEMFDELLAVMKQTEQMKGKVHVISCLHDAGKALQGLGGIGALLRYTRS